MHGWQKAKGSLPRTPSFQNTRKKEFDADISPAFLLNRMELFFGKRIIPGKTLIVFAEVQVCARALTSLKYFCEDAPEYHVIAAGSLLGVSLNRGRYSFPVGKVELLTLIALGIGTLTTVSVVPLLGRRLSGNIIC